MAFTSEKRYGLHETELFARFMRSALERDVVNADGFWHGLDSTLFCV